MYLPLKLARRYLFGKKSTNAINLISGISIFGLTVGSAALVIILSVFNGFESLLSGLYNPFYADIQVTPQAGKTLDIDSTLVQELKVDERILGHSICIEDLALFQYESVQEVGILKGVDKQFKNVTRLDTALLYGDFQLSRNGIITGVIGSGLRNKLALQINQSLTPLSTFTILKKPKQGREYNQQAIYPAGVFSTDSEADYTYLISEYATASRLFEKPGQFSSIELNVSEDSNPDQIKVDYEAKYPELAFKTRYEQDEIFLRILNIEKWIAFLIASLTLVLIAFNLVGSLWMIVLEKQKDYAILKSIGYQKKQIFLTVLLKGLLMCTVGLILGFSFALLFAMAQQSIGFISIPDGLMISSYPIKLRISDFIIVAITVYLIGALGSSLPALRASRISANVNVH